MYNPSSAGYRLRIVKTTQDGHTLLFPLPSFYSATECTADRQLYENLPSNSPVRLL